MGAAPNYRTEEAWMSGHNVPESADGGMKILNELIAECVEP